MQDSNGQRDECEEEGREYGGVQGEPRGVSHSEPLGESKAVLLREQGRTSREVLPDEPQGKSLVSPQGEPRESNGVVPTDHSGWVGNLADKDSMDASVFTDEPQGESLVQPQGAPRESNGEVSTDLTLEAGFHSESAFEMLQLLGWEGNPADVNSIATSVFKNHLLYYSIEAAQAWGFRVLGSTTRRGARDCRGTRLNRDSQSGQPATPSRG